MRRLFSILLVLNCLVLSAQSEFEHLSSIDGLSQNDINFIFQDSKGFMWFGTVDGLNRYDGMNFVTYKPTSPMEKPLGSNLPFCITEDPLGNFWIGTSDAGLWYHNRKKDEFYQIPYTHEGDRLFTDWKVGAIYLDSNGILWVATSNGLTLLDTNEYHKGKYKCRVIDTQSNPGSSEISAYLFNTVYVCEDKRGDMWLGSGYGLFRVELSDQLDLKMTIMDQCPRGFCKGLIETKNGFIGAFYDGIYTINRTLSQERYVVTRCSNRYLNILYESNEGRLWGGGMQGLYQFDYNANTDVFQEVNHFVTDFSNPKSLSKNNITTIYEDRSGLLWVGTNGGGLNKLDLNKKKFEHVFEAPKGSGYSYNKVRGFVEDSKGNLWIGTEGSGLFKLKVGEDGNYSDEFENKSVAFFSSDQNYIYCIDKIPNTKDKFVFGAGYPVKLGVAYYDEKEGIVIDRYSSEISNSAFVVFIDRDDNIWIGTYGDGLYKAKYNVETDKLEFLSHYSVKEGSTSLTSDVIRGLCEDPYGNIFIGTDKGLNVLPVNERFNINPTFKVYQHDANDINSLAHNYVLDIFVDSKNTVWVGSMGGGLCKVIYEENGKLSFDKYTTENGFPNDVIKAIEEDEDGKLWVSTNKGLSRFDPISAEIRNYTTIDGLQGLEFSELASCKRKDGALLFGGVKGFNIFRPSEIVDNPYTSPVEFTDLIIHNDVILPGQKYNNRILLEYEMPSTDVILLKYAENSFSIGFSALHFSAPEKIQYKYMLDGFDVDWNLVNNKDPRAKYTNLSPGKYELKVLATNNDGVWTTVPSVMKIEVIPPFWRTELAIFFYFILFIVMLVFFRKYSIIAVTKKNELMMEHFEQEKMNELVQMKLQFFTNISHEFRTPLTLIQSPLENLIDKNDEIDKTYRLRTYSLMMKNINILNRLINQLMEFRKLERGKMPLAVTRGNLIELVKEVFDAFNEIAESKNIRFELKNVYSSVELWYDYDKMEKVLFNLLSNAFKYTPQSGEVSIIVSEEELEGQEWVRINVKDNGPGIDKDKLAFLFDRFYQAGSHKLSKVSGTGIGLAFAKNLITLHKGEIRVESDADKGTVFSVYLRKGKLHFAKEDFSTDPIETKNEKLVVVKDYQIEKPEKAKENLVLDKNKPTLLITEDNLDVQSLLKENLESEFNCIQAYNGVEGLELAQKNVPDLIISDVMMPEMDGFEMCDKIKNDENICHIPIIMLTAKSTDKDKVHGLTGGAEAYVSKPFNIEVLKAQVMSILDARRLVMQKFSQKIDIEPQEVTFTSIDEKLIERLLKVVEQNISNPEFTVVQLADEVGMSQSNLNKKLKALLGQTANVFIRTIRLKRAAQLLRLDRLSVTDVVYEVGFNDMKYFRECFRKQFNTTPSDYVRTHRSDDSENTENEE